MTPYQPSLRRERKVDVKRKLLLLLTIILCLFMIQSITPSLCSAVGEQYTLPGTNLVLGDSGQTPTPTQIITLSALGASAGRVSTQVDRGAGAHSGYYEWNFTFQLTGTNVLNETVELYIAPSNGTNIAGEVGTANAALTSVNQLAALTLIGVCPVYQTTSNTSMTCSGQFYEPSRYWSLVVYNRSSLPFKTDTAVHKAIITPMPFQIQ